MKKLKLSIILFFVCTTICFAQKIEKDKQKMLDSVLNSMKIPAGQKKMIEQMMQKGMMADKQRKSKKETKKRKKEVENVRLQKIMRSETKSKENADSYYWKNTIASNTQGKFKNWTFGKADIKIRFSKGINTPPDFLKIGQISENGQVTISLPEIDFRKWKRIPITKGQGEGDDLFYDYNKTLEYSNKNVTYFSSRYAIDIMQGDNKLGALSIANSVVTNGNLNAPCCFDKEGDGYIAYWVYMSQANTIKEKADNPNEAVDTNLEFEKGWNIVITRVEGKKAKPKSGLTGEAFWKNKYHTSTSTMPSDAKFYFNSSLVKDKY